MIGAHQFGEFTIDADSLPDSGTQVVFKAIQTYSNGDIVRWIEPVPATGDVPEHPTPILQLTSPNGAAPAGVVRLLQSPLQDSRGNPKWTPPEPSALSASSSAHSASLLRR